MADTQNVSAYIAGLVERARKAQAAIEFASQEQVDEMTVRIAWAGVKPDFAEMLSKFAVEESGMGKVDSKYAEMMTKIKGPLRDMKGQQSVGVVYRDKDSGIIKIAKPMGVVGALIPCTNPEATPFAKAMFAIKTRNAIIMAAHPRTKETNKLAVNQIRSVLKKHGWPEDLVINVDEISMEASSELMKQVDIILATGGGGMVKAAFSSDRKSVV